MALSRHKSGPVRIEVPKPEDEKLRFGRVGIIALVGFVIGIAWPRLAGVKLVPDPPVEEEALTPVAATAAPAQSAAPALVNPTPVQPPPPKPEAVERVHVSPPQVTSCRDAQGERLSTCDKPDVDRFARARLQALASCSGAANASGMLSLGIDLDFSTKKLSVLKGKSTTLAEEPANALLACARAGLEAATLTDLEHTAERYTIFYRVELLPAPPPPPAAAAAAAADDAGAEAAASGRATVLWEVAILRGTASKDGEIVARVLQGTRLVVSGRQGDWYKVKYDARGREGWVYRTAIGL
ncbi:MAG TPA: SH3 domain-containing protein [Polyangiaceae bacterium]